MDGWFLSKHLGRVRHEIQVYVIDLLDEATDFSWALAKASRAVFLWRMEQGEIGSWLETENCDRVRRAHAQRHNTGQSSSQRVQDMHSYAKTANCIYYNKGVCSQNKLMRYKVFFISMCVLCVGQKMTKPTLPPD